LSLPDTKADASQSQKSLHFADTPVIYPVLSSGKEAIVCTVE